MRRAFLALLTGLWLVQPGWAAAEAARWEVLREQSSISLRVGTAMGARTGRFTRWTGDIVFDPQAPRTAHVDIAVEAASLRMDDGVLTRQATGSAFLDAGQYPTLSFRLRSLEPGERGRFIARADITMRGVTRPVVFPVTLRAEGRTAQMTGGFSLDRAAFGIGTSGPWNGLIGRQVRVEVSLATRATG